MSCWAEPSHHLGRDTQPDGRHRYVPGTAGADASSPSGLSTLYLGRPEPLIPIPEVFRFNTVGDGVPDNLAWHLQAAAIPPFTLIVPRRNNGPIISFDHGDWRRAQRSVHRFQRHP